MMTPTPVDIHASQGPAWAFMVVGAVFFLASVIWVLRESRRLSGWVPVLALIGGGIASLEEPWINRMIQLWYPVDSPMVAFTAMGHPQPLYVHLVYPGFVGLGAYVVYRGLVANPDGKLLWPTFFAIAALDLAFELPATAAGVFGYYGAQPFQLFDQGWPAWVAFINAAGPVLGGWLIYGLAPRLVGAERLLLALLPPFAYAGVYGAAGWPTYTLLNTDVPDVARWLAATVTIGLCFAVVRLIMAALPSKATGVSRKAMENPGRWGSLQTARR